MASPCARKRCRKDATHAVVVFIPHPAQVKVCEKHADEAMAHGSTSKIPVSWVERESREVTGEAP